MFLNIEKIFRYVSPIYRVLKGDESRLRTLIDRVEKLQNIVRENAACDIAYEDDEKFDKNLLGEKIDIFINSNSKILKYKCAIQDFFKEMNKYILRTKVVLDVGCGIRPQTFFVPKVHICIEPFTQYRKVVKPFFPNNSTFVFLKGDALSSIQMIDDDSVDTVFMIDLIEHLEKEGGLALLREADRVSRKQIVVFTPLGFYPMHFKGGSEKDAWGLDGNDVQEHKSGWLPEDFGDGWDFHICEDCHEAFLPEEKAAGKKYSGLMAIKTKRFSGFEVMEETPQFVKDVYMERVVNGKTD